MNSTDKAVIPLLKWFDTPKGELAYIKISNKMNAKKETVAQGMNEQLSVLNFHGSNITFEEINGKMMINATQMAKPFNQQPIKWLRTDQAKNLVKALSKVRKWSLADLQVVKRGGNNPGTWFHEDVALLFAQWLSPEFYIACNDKLKELITQRAIALPQKYGIPATVYNGEVLYPYGLTCKELGNVKYPKATLRRKRNPNQFRKLFGRNFITSKYLDLLKGYYDYKNQSNQLKLEL